MNVTAVKSRRRFLAVATAAAVMPSVAAAQQADPIFAIIERHQAAYKDLARPVWSTMKSQLSGAAGKSRSLKEIGMTLRMMRKL
ncbi:hypothetical protein [Nitrobacter hamburgensis]|uniref:hypothetical protein n=1 Tax=Nitrobacter hamburgensis TaxID=912 RepID=UPI0012EEC3F1|nr:hypothetical protein [Nitrobacter hamburgensis]